jgi:hypothetical protein
MIKRLLLLLILPFAAYAQSILVEKVREENTLEAQRLQLIERELGISRHAFRISCDYKFKGIAEVVALPSEEVLFSSKIDGDQERRYSSSVVLTDQEVDGTIYRSNIEFNWFSEHYESENKGIQTGVVGRVSNGGYSRFDFPEDADENGEIVVWVFSLATLDGEWKPAYALRIKQTK